MQHHVRFIDRTGHIEPKRDFWPAILISKEAIDAEIKRLAGLPTPMNGRRRSLIVHPDDNGTGLAPGIQVALDVLNPGERTKPIRHNSSQVNFCISGRGCALIHGKTVNFEQYDVWNTPSMNAYQLFNDTGEIQVRLTYSNAALLEKLNVHIVDEDPPAEDFAGPSRGDETESNRRNPFGTITLKDGGSLLPYEKLINPDVVESNVLHWPWREVREHLDRLQALGSSYVGRRLYMLYNPASGRTNGTTHNFFATITIRPPNIIDKPHRHASAAINYYFAGTGYSRVEGKVIPWKAGDLMLSAPGWAVHHHASNDEPVYELTVQDQPLHIAMDSLVWQEELQKPARMLGSSRGFETNRKAG